MTSQSMPDRWYDGALRYTAAGEVWATWRLEPLGRAHTEEDAVAVHRAHAHLFRAIVGHEFVLNAPLVWTDTEHLIAQMIESVDLETHPEWARECEAAYTQLGDLGLAARRFYLSVKLKLPAREAMQMWAQAAGNRVAEAAGLAPLPPSTTVVHRARALATGLGRRLPAIFKSRPATQADQIWLRVHAQTRSLEHSWDPYEVPEIGEELLSNATISSPYLDPHAMSELDKPSWGTQMRAPLARRWLKVVTDAEETSFQSGMVLRRVPDEMAWPACEFLGRIDDVGVPIDYAIRGVVRSRVKALAENRSAMKKLNFQLDQVDGEEGNPSAAAHLVSVYDGARVLADYNTELARDEQEVEVEPIFLASVAAPTTELVDQYARDFMTSPLWENFEWVRPIGCQEDIFWAMQPANTVSASLGQFRQVALSRAVGATSTVQTTRLGDGRGIPFAIDTSTGLNKIVLLDPFGAARDESLNWGPSIIFIGDMGAGKTSSMMTTCGLLMDRDGAFLFGTDNSRTREWARFARSTGYPTSFVDLAAPELSLDPLRTLPVEQAGTVMKAFLTTLLDLDATEGEGLILSKVLKTAYIREHHIDSAGALQDHLRNHCDLPGADKLADKIEVFSDPDNTGSLARGIFDAALPPMDVAARAVLIGTCGLPLPDSKDVSQQHLYKSLSPTKRFARAIYALIMDLGRSICAADPGRNNIFTIDEFHHVATSAESLQSVDKALREGRRDAVLLLAGTHDTVDLPSELLSLFRYRVALRVNEQQKAGRLAQHLLDLDPVKKADEHAYFEVAIAEGLRDGNGAAILRDGFQALGEIQLLLPSGADRRAAVVSTPKEKKQQPAVKVETQAGAMP